MRVLTFILEKRYFGGQLAKECIETVYLEGRLMESDWKSFVLKMLSNFLQIIISIRVVCGYLLEHELIVRYDKTYEVLNSQFGVDMSFPLCFTFTFLSYMTFCLDYFFRTVPQREHFWKLY